MVEGAPLTDPEALAAWAQMAWRSLGIERPNVIDVWKGARKDQGLPERPEKSPDPPGDSFSRRAIRRRGTEIAPRPDVPGHQGTKLRTAHTARRLRESAGDAPPIPIGSADVGGDWFRALFAASGHTMADIAARAGISQAQAQWVVRGSMGKLTAARRLAMLRATRFLAPNLYTPKQWKFLETRTAPANTRIRCLVCREWVVVGSSQARPICPACRESRRPKRLCLECGEAELTGTVRQKYCPACRKKREAARNQAYRIRTGGTPTEPHKPYVPRPKRTPEERRRLHVLTALRWRERNPEHWRRIERARRARPEYKAKRRERYHQRKREAQSGTA